MRHNCSYEALVSKRTSELPQDVIRAKDSPSSLSSVNQERPASTISHHGETVASSPRQIGASLSSGPEHYLGIPSTLVLKLIDVYYANVYNATLLLHKPTFLEAVAAGKMKAHVLLSVCAWAANFYRDASCQATLRDHGFMMEWADRAGKLVFQEVENPHEDNIVTFINLALLFYARGLWRRSYIHKGNATLLAQILGLGSDHPGKEDLWESEVRRRRFWASYLIEGHSSESTSMIVRQPPESTLKLTLPWREEDFEVGIPSQPRACLDSGQSNGGLFCELIKAMTIWSAVNGLIKKPITKIDSRISAIHALDQRISEWWGSLPACLHLMPSDIPDVALDVLPKLLLLHVIYHQSLTALHASIVPLFSWSPGDDSWLSARQISAQVAFDHACTASDLFRAVLTHFSMLSAIPSFVAYAAYCGCAIQIPYMWCSQQTVMEKAHKNVKVNIKIITTLSEYWKLNSLFEVYVRYLYKIHSKAATALENEPKSDNPVKLTGFKFSAENATKTILGFNRILWTKDNGYAAPGEELNDLGVEDRDIHIMEESVANCVLQTKPAANIFPSQEQYQRPVAPTERFNPFSDSTSSNWEEMEPELDVTPQNLVNLDSFRPFDPDIAWLDADMLDLSQFGASPLNLEFLGGCPASSTL